MVRWRWRWIKLRESARIGVIRDRQSERFWGDYDADYKTRIAADNRILVLESPLEIHARLWSNSFQILCNVLWAFNHPMITETRIEFVLVLRIVNSDRPYCKDVSTCIWRISSSITNTPHTVPCLQRRFIFSVAGNRFRLYIIRRANLHLGCGSPDLHVWFAD